MSRPSFIYVTYINSTPERVWQALTDPAFTRKYWVNHRNASDWKVGSEWRHEDYDDASLVDIVGHVVEISPPRHLVLTWASPKDAKDPDKVSRVTFDIETCGDGVRLTVTHSELEPDSPMLSGISRGWPLVLSSLKTLLETGEPLPSLLVKKAKTELAAGVMRLRAHFTLDQGWSREGQAALRRRHAPSCLSRRRARAQGCKRASRAACRGD